MLAGLINILNLDMFVIGGGVRQCLGRLCPAHVRRAARTLADLRGDRTDDPNDSGTTLSPAREAHQPRSRNYASKKTIITRALLGSDAGLYGAARIPAL